MKIYTILFSLVLTGCTISLSNVSTNGKATDVLDESQEASPDINLQATVPLA